MQELWRIFVMILIIRKIGSQEFVNNSNCEESKYNEECLCVIHDPYHIMECPSTITSNSVNFKIKYLYRKMVEITCVNNPNWSNFHYEINSVTQEVKNFSLKNCSLLGNVSLSEIAKLLGAEKTKTLEFSNNLKHKNLTLKKDHLQGFSDVVKLTISENHLLGELDEDLLQFLPQLTMLILRGNQIKSIPKNFFKYVTNLTDLELGNNKLQIFEPETFKNLKNLKFLNIWGNQLIELESHTFSDLIFLESLDLHNNNLTSLPADIFNQLKKLKLVNLSGNQFQSLPGTLFQMNQELRTVKFRMERQLKTLPSGLFSNLMNLTTVQLDGCKLESLPEDLFKGSNNLEEIHLNANALRTLPLRIFKDLEKLNKLSINDNQIEDLPDNVFLSCESLEELQLNRNKLTNISSSLFKGLSSLKTLSMFKNNITAIGKFAFYSLNDLMKINLSHNNIVDIKLVSAGYGELSIFSNCKNLHELDLSFNRIPLIYNDWIITPHSKFTYLDLSHNEITIIMRDNLDFKHTHDFSINLSYNKIKVIELDEDFEYNYLQERRNNVVLNIENNPVACGCALYGLIRYLDGTMDKRIRDKLEIKLGSIECSSPKELEGTLLSNLNTKDFKCIPTPHDRYDNPDLCPKSCTQWKKPFDKILIFDCANKNLIQAPETLCNLANNQYFYELDLTGNFITDIPSPKQLGYENVKTLLLSHNQITNITKNGFSPKLRFLELHNNKIATVSEEALNQMNSSLMSVTLGGNPWICNCDTRAFQHFIQTNDLNIVDVEKVTCENSNKILRSLTVNELCSSEVKMIVGVSLMVAILGLTIGILAALYYRYQNEIKIWLYAHQMCLWLVTEEELDKDKPYDAFLSYSHQDEDFVINELVTKLEEGPRPFKLCIHFRDWLAGEWIPTQIAKSVKDSKRTIVVVSPNFVRSEWGRLEFRAAHSQALNEGRARVIVILYGDIGPIDDLEPELKTYLSMNTYVKWGDPWFWDKLRYALPHKSDLINKIPMTKIFKRQHPSAQLVFNKNEMNRCSENGMTPLTENKNKNLQNGNVSIEISDDESKKLNSKC